jgi:hypothetical protein
MNRKKEKEKNKRPRFFFFSFGCIIDYRFIILASIVTIEPDFICFDVLSVGSFITRHDGLGQNKPRE